MIPTKFQINWSFSSGEEAKNIFSRWLSWRPSWISDWNNFSYFSSTSHPDASNQVSSQLGIQEKKLKIDFQDGRCGGDLGFSIGMIIAILIYMSTRCFLPSFESIGLLVEEKKRKVDFQDGGSGGHLGFLIDTVLAVFNLYVTPVLSAKFRVKWPRGVGRVGF